MSSTMASVTVRVDPQTKKDASSIAEEYGFDLSSVTRAFYKQIVREHAIPLNLGRHILPVETERSLQDARTMIGESKPRFDSADAMFENLGI